MFGKNVRISRKFHEPTDIIWQEYGVSTCVRCRRAAISFCIWLSVLVIWTLFYYPWQRYTSAVYRSQGMKPGPILELLLGALTALGNALVAATIGNLGDYVGWFNRGSLDAVIYVTVVFCVGINVVADMFVMYWNIVGSWEKNLGLSRELILSTEFLQQYGFAYITEEFHALLFPGYLLTPYIGEPIATLVAPYLLAKLRVRIDPTVSRRHTCELLAAPDADIINPPYCDIMVNCSLVFLTLFVPSLESWWILAQLTISLICLYWVYKARLLRVHRRRPLLNRNLDWVASRLWVLPLSALALNVSLYLVPAQVLV